MDIGKLVVALGLDSSDLEKGIGKMKGLVSGAVGELSGMGSVLSGVVVAGAVAATAAIAALGAGIVILIDQMFGIGKAGLEAFIPFQKGMLEVFSLMPGMSEKAMGEMTGDIKDFAKEFGVLPDKAIPALYEALSAGVPQDNVFEFLETAQKAAVGGVTELEVAVDGLSSVVNAYGSDVIDHAKASDIMFQTVKLGKTTFDELSASIYNVVPVAASMGLKFEDVGAALAAMTAQGVPTSVATTQLRQLLIELNTAGTDVSDSFLALSGKTFQEFIAEGHNLQDALKVIEGGFTSVEDSSGKVAKITEKIADLKDQLEVATIRQGEFTEKTSAATRAASENKIADLTQEIANLDAELAMASTLTGETHTKMSDLFGSVEAGQAALILTGKGTQTFTNDLLAMNEAAGSTDAAFQTMDSGIGRTIEKIQAAGQILLIEIGEKLAPVFQSAVNEVLNLMPQISQSVLSVTDQIVPFIQAAFDTALPTVKSFFQWISNTGVPFITQALQSALPRVQAFFAWFRGTALPWIMEFSNRAGSILMAFFNNFDSRFGPSLNRLENAIGMVSNAFKTATGETSAMDSILSTLQLVINGVAIGFDLWSVHIESVAGGISALINVLRTVYNTVRDIVNLVPNFFGSGLFALSGGKTFQQLGFAEGGSFVVPPGFPNDSFPIGLTSGEHVQVTPASQMNSNNRSFTYAPTYNGVQNSNPEMDYYLMNSLAG